MFDIGQKVSYNGLISTILNADNQEEVLIFVSNNDIRWVDAQFVELLEVS